MALAMIEGAEREGLLRPGQTVVEYTGGSTGTSLAFVCALKGYPLRIVTSDAFAAEKLATMRAFGAELEVISSPKGITPDLIPSMRQRAAEIVEESGGYPTDQFTNRHMVDGYRSLGMEIAQQVAGPVDAYCGYIGTAGCFLGATGALRAVYPEMQRVAIEPTESAVLSGGSPGTHRIEGGGVGFRPPQLVEMRSTRCRRSPPPKPSPAPVAPSARKAFSAARRPARTCSSRYGWRSGWSRPPRGDRPGGLGHEVPRRRPLPVIDEKRRALTWKCRSVVVPSSPVGPPMRLSNRDGRSSPQRASPCTGSPPSNATRVDGCSSPWTVG